MMEYMGETVGSFLKENREGRGISIEEIASETKINVNILAMLEKDEFTELPAAPFVRGFIRAYAKYVGLDPKKAILLYENMHPVETEINEHINVLSERDGIKLETFGKKYTVHGLVIGVVIAILAIALLVVKLTDPSKKIKSKLAGNKIEKSMVVNLNEKTAAAQTVSAAAQPETVVNTAVSEKKVAAGTPAVAETVKPKNEVKAVSEVTDVEQKQDVKPESGVAAKSETVSSDAEESPKDQEVLISAKSIVWIKVQVDDDKPFDFMLAEGRTKHLKASGSIKLLIGDASAVDIKYNGKKLGPVGGEGIVRTMVFPGLGRWRDAQLR
ncbi:MAG: DUF4115 domain-containing protein [Oligoflexia bacterium]|nr:DUF4115 domain-containing protein [Oligoflexia bacterium]